MTLFLREVAACLSGAMHDRRDEGHSSYWYPGGSSNSPVDQNKQKKLVMKAFAIQHNHEPSRINPAKAAMHIPVKVLATIDLD